MSAVLYPLISPVEQETNILLPPETKPNPESYDSGEECSLAHLVHVLELLEGDDQQVDRCVFDDFCLHVA